MGFHVNVSAVDDKGETVKLSNGMLTELIYEWLPYERKHYKTYRGEGSDFAEKIFDYLNDSSYLVNQNTNILSIYDEKINMEIIVGIDGSDRELKEQLKSLEKNGYISRASEDEWLITENGIEQIFKSAAVYRGQKERFLGKRYVANTNKQISNIAKSDSMDKYDEEEEILIAVENRMRLIKNRRASQKSKYRSQ
jgi:hypothetical protein